MDTPTLVWGAKEYLAVALGASAIFLTLIFLAYRGEGSSAAPPWVRGLAATMKILAIALLALCLLEPLLSGKRAKQGANKFAILADNSQSMTLRDKDAEASRGAALAQAAGHDPAWLATIGRDFEVRSYSFDSQLHSTDELATLKFDGQASNLGTSLQQIVRRYQGQPLAGILLFTDGGATDRDAVEKVLADSARADYKLPPIYPVVMGGTPAADLSIDKVSVTQTNFEDAPVTIAAQIVASDSPGRNIVAELLDDSGHSVEKQTARAEGGGEPTIFRFRVKPEKPGLSFYTVRTALDGNFSELDHPDTSPEATISNNTRSAVVDRGGGPYKVLYVTGRMNPEFKFLQRSLSSDQQIELTGLIRVAKREPKFNFISRDSANPLFKGFDPQSTETVEQFDQPIIMKVTENGDKIEPHAVFPTLAKDLDAYEAVILDRVESEFFTPDQMQMLKEFVRQRGGGLLMLGGEESFKNGKYDRTAIGDVLPVYCDEVPLFPDNVTFRLALTREGWLEPWMRLRPEEAAEQQRLDAMPPFFTVNAIRGIKPGATVLARALTDQGLPVPAMVEQQFGRGRSAALLIGDLWLWQMHQASTANNDLEKAWRQTVRWLIADVPKRLEAVATPSADAEDAPGSMRIVVQVRDEVFAPLDNASVKVRIAGPDKKVVELRAEPSLSKPGQYEATYVAHQSGAYRADVTVTGPDGADLGQVAAGWSAEPAAEEFRALAPDRALLERLAKTTGGEIVDLASLERFADSLPTRNALITETYAEPLWHNSWVFLIAIFCLGMEWALRRWKGLA